MASGSNRPPSASHSHTGEGSSRMVPKTTRGHNRSTRRRMREGRIKVELNDRNQPIGQDSKTISRHIGQLARMGSMVPLSYPDWRHIPTTLKDNMMNSVLQHFDIHPDRSREWVLEKFNTLWKKWKYQLKEDYFNPNLPIQQQYESRPEKDVIPSQWVSLVDLWHTEKNESMTVQNEDNRSKLTIHHTAGTHSFAYLRELDKMETGVYPDKVRMFEITYTKKNKSMDPPAKEAMSQIQHLVSQMPEGTQPSEARKRAFYQVFGEDKHGRERGVGCGGKPIGGKVAKATAALTEQVEKYKQLYEEAEARRKEAERENAASRAEKTEFIANMERFNKCMESMGRHLGGSEVLGSEMLAALSQFRFSIQQVQLDSDETQPPDATQPLA